MHAPALGCSWQEFRDAIESLSPEQQRFAKVRESMNNTPLSHKQTNSKVTQRDFRPTENRSNAQNDLNSRSHTTNTLRCPLCRLSAACSSPGLSSLSFVPASLALLWLTRTFPCAPWRPISNHAHACTALALQTSPQPHLNCLAISLPQALVQIKPQMEKVLGAWCSCAMSC